MPKSTPMRAVALTASLIMAALPAVAGPAPLPPEVEAALARGQVPKDALVALVQEVGQPASRLAWQPHQPVNPASLQKLLTTSAALDLLGPAWTWNTPVWIQGEVADGVLKGSLVIKGSGDPKFVIERLWLLLRRVQQLGVREIQGDIVLDRSAFTVPPHNPAAFDNEPYKPSNAGPDALMLNYKSVTYTFTPQPLRGVATVGTDVPLAGVRVDTTVPLLKGPCDDWRGDLRADFTDATRVRFTGGYAASCGERQWPAAYGDPKSYNERVIAGLWRDLGGRLTGRVRDGVAPTVAPTFEVASPSLADTIRDINKFSNNVMAQQLFLTLGATQRGTGSPEQARDVVRQWLVDRFGDNVAGTVVENGSGLSRDSRVTAQLLARVLQAMWAGPAMPELMSSLPVSGIDGTMRRTRNASTGRAHLKTGSLRDVTGIAGYVLAASGKRYVVVGVINHPNAAAARPALEALVQWTAAD
ncbi:D-alanyl-D-alanine carboxypeptidase/D-alanyl-D-alanine-endopeptidase [Rhizobacter sp. Root1221]|uniref:D-alanyl-D-alanine carboxypeptidase/D-alanyl-D-alanine endopeptidase n=1 Tax=Rhizobacter sp. Root1221 TaxID=1736433 RepID=UPI0006FD7E4B|nr:D-alanyl-D-alanine carboxypeptidase/D-alanyl-D-alanine-endopeptidase [Rhizobacter sp. Root1221]KQV91530.1 peptidase M15 [Rhizobacter sp. Root1221]